ncbi:hypothetical protein SAMN05428950_1011307 [Sphingomonas sp. OV641]|uniref:hypothetical protein n=1 Tax=Sphingomonas sp. OV641 TaxID=1881068 RepID=UPI0008BBDB49|nr:hypothetical protein [Sphingomonas sp. OV641]SEJ15869.1 hypothetical protein SAMN05428950_1011307 [Sphingomonas sp. OV641]
MVVDPLVQDAKDAAGNTELISDAITGAPAALPIGNNPNDLIAKVANADNEQPFEVLIVDTNTGPAWLEAGGFRRAIGRDGAGNDTVAGDLTKGKIATFQYSAGGGRFILTGTRDIDDDASGQVVDPDLANKPWGNVTYASGGTGARTVTAITKYVTVVGSSNAHPDYVDAAHLPANVAAAALNEFVPGTGITYAADTRAQPGAPMVTIASQLDASTAFQAGNTPYVLTMYGMNDARTLFYHDNGGIMAQLGALEAVIETIRKGGAEPVLNTIFPPDPRSSTVALDPNYYADTSAYPAGGSTRAMDFPAYHAAPVSPENHMEPRLSQLTVVLAGNVLLPSPLVRIVHSRVLNNTVTGGTTTYEALLELAGAFTHVNPLLAVGQNVSANATSPAYFVFAAAVPDTTKASADAATWTSCSMATANLSPASAVNKRAWHYGNRYTRLQSVPRTDGGTGYLALIRAQVSAGTVVLLGNGTDVFSNWENEPNGFRWRDKPGSFATSNQAGFDATAFSNRSPIAGVAYLTADGVGKTLCSVGDSNGVGYGAHIGANHVFRAAQALTAKYGLPVEYCDLAWGGFASTAIRDSVIDLFNPTTGLFNATTGLMPSCIYLNDATQNDWAVGPTASAITDATIRTMEANLAHRSQPSSGYMQAHSSKHEDTKPSPPQFQQSFSSYSQ